MVGACSICGYAVDWGRACHTSKWRLFKGSPRVVSGFHYFDDEAPFYPDPHNLWNRDWVAGRKTVFAGLGDWGGPRTFYGGAPPALKRHAKRIGTAACIEEGLDPGTVSVLGKSPWCGTIDQPGCYLTSDPIELVTNPLDCLWAHNAAVIIEELYRSVAGGVIAAQEFFGEDAVVTGEDRLGDRVPRTVAVRIRDQFFLFSEGTITAQQWIEQIRGASGGCVDFGQWGTIPIWQECATEYVARIGRAGGSDGRRFQLIGHSMGGAACCLTAAMIHTYVPDRQIELLTFGCPKPGDVRLQKVLAGVLSKHYVNEGDAVPYVPPRGADIWTMLTALGLPLIPPAIPFERPVDVCLVTNDGEFKPLRTEEIDADLVANVIAFVRAGGDVRTFGPHRMPTYIYRIGQACPCVNPPPPEPEPILVEDMDGFKIGDYAILPKHVSGDGYEIGDGDDVPLTLDGDGFEIGDGDSIPLTTDGDGFEIGDGDDLPPPTDGFTFGDFAFHPEFRDGFEIGDGDDVPALPDGDGFEVGDGDDVPLTTDGDGFEIGDGDDIEPPMDGFTFGEVEFPMPMDLSDGYEIGDGDDIDPPPVIPPGDGPVLGETFLGDIIIDQTDFGGPLLSWSGVVFTWHEGTHTYQSPDLEGLGAQVGRVFFGSAEGAWRVGSRTDGAYSLIGTEPDITVFEGPIGNGGGLANVFNWNGITPGEITLNLYPDA